MIMSRSSSPRSFGASLFRKPAYLTRKIFFLVMVPFAFLVILYRSHNYVTVSEGSQWPSKPAELDVEQFQQEEFNSEDTLISHKVPLASLTGSLWDEEAVNGEEVDEEEVDEEEVDEEEVDEEEVDEEGMDEEEWNKLSLEQKPGTSPYDQSAQFEQLAQSPTQRYTPPHESADDVTIVAARQGEDSTDWIEEFCKGFPCNAYIYSLDDEPGPEFLVPYSRKGHEASAYLSYIIDYYDNLAPYTIFLHGRAEHWHNDVSGPSTKNVLANLRFEAVALKGYVNLRCTNRPGCPSTLFQAHPVTLDFDYEYMIAQMPRILWELLRIDPSEAPEDIGHQCCAQFALTREWIQERPRSDYERILEWIATTDMTDNYGIGWLIEKLWHVIFGMPAVYCISEEQCRCDLYGWCGPNPLTHNQMLTPIS